MKNIYGIILAAAVFFAAGLSDAEAQGTGKLPSDPKISEGTFPNGMSWYVAENPAEKGFADFALVCRHPADSRDYVGASRRILSARGRLRNRNLQKFLSSNAVAPTEKGYAEYSDDAVTFRFENVMLQRSPSLADSLLLAVFGVAGELSSGVVTETDSLHFPLEDMAVIVSGDVNKGELVTKMGIFSLMVPDKASDPAAFAIPKDPAPKDPAASAVTAVPVTPEDVNGIGKPARKVEVTVDTLGNVCRISASFRFPGVPGEFRRTPRFAVVGKMSETFRFIAENRLRDALNALEIPFAEIRSEHISLAEVSGSDASGSDASGSDAFGSGASGYDSIDLSFCVPVGDSDAAVRCFGGVLGALDRGEISVGDIIISSALYDEKCYVSTSCAVKNSEYQRICSAAFLNGAPLVTEARLCGFCQSKALPDTLQLRLMKGFAEALLAPDDSCEAFLAGWNGDSAIHGQKPDGQKLSFQDTLLLPAPSLKKSRVRTGKELMSGGEIWTFQNGLKVYYKRVPGAKNLCWALNVDKGYASAEGLVPGEAAFLSDLLKCRTVQGIGNSGMRNIMTASGITADAEVSLHSTTLKGTAAPRSLDLLLKGLVGMFRGSVTDSAAVAGLMRTAAVQRELAVGGRGARLAGIDSLICADNPWSGVKMYNNFTRETAIKAEHLFNDVFSDLGNGFLVLSGDMEASSLKKKLAWYAGEFPVTERQENRSRVRFSPVSGQSTNFRRGPEESIDVLLSAALPMNAANLCASRLAVYILEDSLHGALVGTGFHVKMSPSFIMYPQERFSVLVSLDRIPEDGFACGSLEDNEILSVLARLRSALSAVPSLELSPAVLNACKARLNSEHDAESATAEYWRDALVTRYADGRDFSTKINGRMNAVTAAQVDEVLEKLISGSRVEYVVMK